MDHHHAGQVDEDSEFQFRRFHLPARKGEAILYRGMPGKVLSSDW
jgi:hypothetical protein